MRTQSRGARAELRGRLHSSHAKRHELGRTLCRTPNETGFCCTAAALKVILIHNAWPPWLQQPVLAGDPPPQPHGIPARHPNRPPRPGGPGTTDVRATPDCAPRPNTGAEIALHNFPAAPTLTFTPPRTDGTSAHHQKNGASRARGPKILRDPACTLTRQGSAARQPY